jgi:hypothetical protein
MTTPVPDFFDIMSIVTRLRDPASVRMTRAILEGQIQVLEAQVAQLREVSKNLGEVQE